ncbi:ATP-binding cassette domain-containing protein [Pseudoduganella chitinolytica]|uniref:ATP-binding cassette domain-containing protein n=1 Tax=Pseudoduganella chitinolytica TaxID=34070 RepID=A0ABY8B8E1_9BURK|nr:ATP-binding cassette domain-containing protein [Pseudoduganella chitinolytica]WEF32204.1 ATP-binding cassette domain-containing protein [Pseudoduganella chitinolytica]
MALTGTSGCGKTTFLKLLCGMLEPTEGTILIFGKPISIDEKNQAIGHIATVLQEDTLFAGTLEQNISFFDKKDESDRVVDCAKMASIHEDIVAMPMGYQTLVGDIGTSLSGGQKQRLMLARAFYKRSEILVLDEATSHLDLHNESRVNFSIEQANVTRIIAAHRKETIDTARRVLKFENGTIVADFHNDHSGMMLR